jgi:hypothetical protein
VLVDIEGNANIIHWTLVKCRRVTRSVLVSKLYTLIYGFDIAVAIKTTLDLILRKEVLLVLYTDSKSIYNYIVKLGTT